MFKTFMTVMRGRNAEAAEAFADANALTLLDQQIRDALADLAQARRALAIATAQDSMEAERIAALRTKAVDLEVRATAALDGGREDLAMEAAEAIATLEIDLSTAETAHARFKRECAKLRAATTNAERRLSDLQRGRQAARAAESVRRLRSQGEPRFGGGASALTDAEATLKRLQQRQIEDEAATEALDSMERTAGADQISEKLESAGFGDTTKPTARSVMERLQRRRNVST